MTLTPAVSRMELQHIKTALISLEFLACLCLPSELLAANGSALGRLLSVRAGQEQDTSLNYMGLTLGCYADKWPEKLPLFKAGRSFLAKDQTKIGIEAGIGYFDKATLTSAEIDLSLMPKIRYTGTSGFFAAGGLGVAYNELRGQDSPEVRLRLGSDAFFTYEFNLGYEFSWAKRPVFVEYVFSHRSNGDLAASNQSLNVHLISIGTWF